MAQQARPKVTGQGEFRRAQLKTRSMDVVTNPGSKSHSRILIRRILIAKKKKTPSLLFVV